MVSVRVHWGFLFLFLSSLPEFFFQNRTVPTECLLGTEHSRINTALRVGSFVLLLSLLERLVHREREIAILTFVFQSYYLFCHFAYRLEWSPCMTVSWFREHGLTEVSLVCVSQSRGSEYVHWSWYRDHHSSSLCIRDLATVVLVRSLTIDSTWFRKMSEKYRKLVTSFLCSKKKLDLKTARSPSCTAKTRLFKASTLHSADTRTTIVGSIIDPWNGDRPYFCENQQFYFQHESPWRRPW